MDSEHPVVRIHLWLETELGVYFGQGRLQLLEQIHEQGSLSGAARALGMSYRGAWGKIKTTERILGFQLVEKSGGNRSGYQLSPFAHMLIDRYKQWLEEVESEAVRLARQLFPCDPVSYGEQTNSQEGQPAQRRKSGRKKTRHNVSPGSNL